VQHVKIFSFFHSFFDKTKITLDDLTFPYLWNEFSTIASYRLIATSEIKIVLWYP